MKKGIPQEALRAVALITMLIDHVGATLLPQYGFLRGIGRLAFPIFAFLLAEGADHTRHPVRYVLRLLIAAILSELPFDLMVYRWALDGQKGHLMAFLWQNRGMIFLRFCLYQNVIITFLFAIFALYALKFTEKRGVILRILGLAMAGLCVLGAEACKTDYGAFGVLTVLLFHFFWHRKWGPLLCAAGFTALCFWLMDYYISIGPVSVPLEVLGALSIPLMCLYKGWRASKNKTLQWAFYLFYPVHIAVICMIAFL